MIERLGVPIAMLATVGVLAACGGSGPKTVTVTTPVATTPTSTGTTSTPAATTPTGSTSPGAASANLKAAEAANPALVAEVARAVASCKAAINAQSQLTAPDKAKLAAICDKAGTGDTAGVQKATAEVCQQVVKDTVPAASQAQALAACPKP
jgi:hypothetical protein